MKSRKKEKSCQTVINMMENQREYETFSYLYDKDQDLLKSEKAGLLKYLRKEVVQNQEFLDRIAELEQINQFLLTENERHRNQLGEAQLYIEQIEEQLRKGTVTSEDEIEEEMTSSKNPILPSALSQRKQSIRPLVTMDESVDCCELLN